MSVSVTWHACLATCNPWIDSARLPANPSKPVLPTLPADAPYTIPLAVTSRDMRTIHIDGNAFLNYHRIGMETDTLFRSKGLHENPFMTPSNPDSLASDYQVLLDYSDNGPENAPGCKWRYPPGGCLSQCGGAQTNTQPCEVRASTREGRTSSTGSAVR